MRMWLIMTNLIIHTLYVVEMFSSYKSLDESKIIKYFSTFQVDTPLCSAKRLNEVVTEVNDYFESPESFGETKLLEEKVRILYMYLMPFTSIIAYIFCHFQ